MDVGTEAPRGARSDRVLSSACPTAKAVQLRAALYFHDLSHYGVIVSQ